LARIYVGAVLRKPSVSRVMTGLSVLFLLFWIAAAGMTAASLGDRDHHPTRHYGHSHRR
jgi:hypothetical protein